MKRGRIRTKRYDKWINDILDWSAKRNPDTVKEWETFLTRFLEDLGWNKRAIADYISWGEHGFNDKRHHDENDEFQFYSEVSYCSDRMSMDRLFRCHSMYRNIKR